MASTKEYKVAIYCRLSKEDERDDKESKEIESASIATHDVICKGWFTPLLITP